MRPALAVALAAVLSSGCGDREREAVPSAPGGGEATPVACTRASCVGAAAIRLRGVPDGAASAEVCVDGQCESVRAPVPDPVRVELPAENRTGGPSERRAEVTADIRDRSGRTVASGSATIQLDALRPNGARCTPTCWTGAATVDVRSG